MKITIATTINASPEAVWQAWTTPQDITQWNHATADWACPHAEINLQPGGQFNYRMEAKDGSMGFDFSGEFTSVEAHQEIVYALEDGRQVSTTFTETDQGIKVEQHFDAEDERSAGQQKQGWQAILNNFKRHVESNHKER